MEFEFKGKRDPQPYKYVLREECTGQDYMHLRRAAHGDVTTYGLANLVMRLESWTRPEEISEDTVLALPMDVFKLLYNVAFNLETEEVREAEDFLMTLLPALQERVSSRISRPSSGSPLSTSAAFSDKKKNPKS